MSSITVYSESNPQAITKYGRFYVRVNPAPNLGPDTLRLAITDSLGGDSGPDAYSFSGETPINVTVTAGAVENVDTAINFVQLDSRTD